MNGIYLIIDGGVWYVIASAALFAAIAGCAIYYGRKGK